MNNHYYAAFPHNDTPLVQVFADRKTRDNWVSKHKHTYVIDAKTAVQQMKRLYKATHGGNDMPDYLGSLGVVNRYCRTLHAMRHCANSNPQSHDLDPETVVARTRDGLLERVAAWERREVRSAFG